MKKQKKQHLDVKKREPVCVKEPHSKLVGIH